MKEYFAICSEKLFAFHIKVLLMLCNRLCELTLKGLYFIWGKVNQSCFDLLSMDRPVRKLQACKAVLISPKEKKGFPHIKWQNIFPLQIDIFCISTFANVEEIASAHCFESSI